MQNELDDLVRQIHSPALFFDMETGRLLALNDQFARLMEYSVEEMLRMSIRDLRPAEDIPLLERALRQAPPAGSVEWRYLTRSGSLLYVQITYRNSLFLETRTREAMNFRMVVISKWDTHPTRSAWELFGPGAIH
jgi:PAS domain-containing protein